MTIRSRCLALGTILLGLSSCSGSEARDDQWHPRMVAEIGQTNRAMEEAFGRGDLLGVARFYADDACLVAVAAQRRTCGRAAIDQYWQRIPGPREWKLEIEEIGGGPDEAYQLGRSTLVYGSPTAPDTSVVDFILIWKRQADGSWRIARDVY